MKEEKAEKLFQGVTGIGDDLIAEAGTAQVEKRKKLPAWRWGAVAACLCLALVGTAVAAQYFGVRIVDGAGGDKDPDIWLEGGISYYPVDSLSEEVMELDDPMYSGRSFDSWDEIEDFIGVDLMNNPVLDTSPARGRDYEIAFRWGDGTQRIRGRFLAIGSGNLTSIWTIGCYKIGTVKIRVEGHLFTDRMEKGRENWDERFMGFSFSDEDQVSWEDYTTPGGLEVHLAVIDRPGSSRDKCQAIFSLNGIPYIVDAEDCGQDLAAARETLLQILDGFQV